MSDKNAIKAARKAAVDRLGMIVVTMEKLSQKCKQYCIQLQSKTDAAITRIRVYYERSNSDADRARYLKHFIAQWFTNFLGCKDEAMTLLKGEITRQYHITEHKDFLHSRGEQNKWYKSANLSACSVDGWRYELERVRGSIGSKASLEDLLDSHADRCDQVGDALERIISTMDKCGESLRSALLSLQPSPAQLTFELSSKDNHHMGERLCIILREGLSTPNLNWTRAGAQKVSREDALSTVLEDPVQMLSNAGLQVSNSAKPVTALLNIADSRRRNVIVTDEDVENQVSERREQADKALREERRRRAAEDDFSMKAISLDDIKRAYGAQSLLTTAHSRNADSDEDESKMETTAAGEQHEGQKTLKSSQNANFDSELATLLGHKSRAVITMHPGLPAPLQKTINVIVLVPASLVRIMQQTTGAVHGRQMSISVSWGGWATSLEEKEGQNESPLCIGATEVMEEVYRRVWSLFNANGTQEPLPLLPRSVRTSYEDSAPHGYGSLVPMPADAKRPLLVQCEEDAIVQGLLWSVAQTVSVTQSQQAQRFINSDEFDISRDNFEQHELRNTARRVSPVVPSMPILERFVSARMTSTASAAFPLLDLSNLRDTLIQQEVTVDMLFREISLLGPANSASTEHGPGTVADINLSLTTLTGTLLHEFLYFGRKIVAESAALDSYELRVCATCLAEEARRILEANRIAGEKAGSMITDEAKTSHVQLPYLEELDLRGNDLFDNHSEALLLPSGPIGSVSALSVSSVEMFLSELMVATPALKLLDVSHCCSRSKPIQALALVHAILGAIERRLKKGLGPLAILRIRGLRMLAARNLSGRHTLNVDQDLLAKLTELMPACQVDVEGANMKLY